MGRLKGCLKKLEIEKKKENKEKRIHTPTPKAPSSIQDKRIPMHLWSDGIKSTIPIRSFINPDSSRNANTILVIGDGDLSYTVSLIKDHLIIEDSIVTSVPEKNEDTLIKDFRCQNNISTLKNVKILYGIDVNKKLNLSEMIGGDSRISRIIFNHPHTGEGIKNRSLNIKSQQKLILNFLLQSSQWLDDLYKKGNACGGGGGGLGGVDDGLGGENVNEYLKRSSCMAMNHSSNESGIEISTSLIEPEIHLTVWEGDPYDLWDIKKMAQKNCPLLSLKETFPFIHKRYPSYKHQKTNGHSQESFEGRKSRTYVFVRKCK